MHMPFLPLTIYLDFIIACEIICEMENTLINQLNLKYTDFKNALKEKRLFTAYKYMYEYFDVIHVQEYTQTIIDHDRKEIEAKRIKVQSDRELNENDRKKIITRIEDYSPSCCYDRISNKVYLPVKAYKESLTPPYEEFLIGRALIVEEGDKRVIEVITELLYETATGNIEAFKIFWKQVKYRFNIEKFSSNMDTLHSTLVRKTFELSPIMPNENTSDKINIIIDDRKGIYQSSNPELFYGIKKISKRMKLIKHLVSKDNCSLSELNRITKQDKVVTMKSIPEINDLFRAKLNLNDDLILSIDTGGYSINKDVYAVTIKQ